MLVIFRLRSSILKNMQNNESPLTDQINSYFVLLVSSVEYHDLNFKQYLLLQMNSEG